MKMIIVMEQYNKYWLRIMQGNLWQEDFTTYKAMDSPASTQEASFSPERQKMYIFHLSDPPIDSIFPSPSGQNVLADVLKWF
jgi:hypothetical protein